VKGHAGVGVAALLLTTVLSYAVPAADFATNVRAAAPAADSATGVRAAALTAASDSSAKTAGPKRPRPKAGKRRAGRSGARDTLSAAELKRLDLPPAPAAPMGRPPKVTLVGLDVRHQVFGHYRERVVVGMRDDFRVGDSDFTARIIDFVPDWAMGLQSFRVLSRTNEPNNPAFRIVVHEKGQVRDTVWAFLHRPPHFARNSMLSFKVFRIEFADHAAIPNAAPDSAAARKPDSTVVRRGKS